MNNRLFIIAIGISLFITAGIAFFAAAQKPTLDVSFPIPELGGCESQSACKEYCDVLEHQKACIAFAEQHGLITAEEARMARSVVDKAGPGGCKGKDACEAYCSDSSHMRECIEFAKENGLIPPEELEEAERVVEILEEGGATPGNCANKEACELYCSDDAHFEECLNFAERAGFVSPDEAKKLRSIGSFKGPGGCNGKEECEEYCSEPAHLEECLSFAEAHGFISKKEAELARKHGRLEGPGGCKSEEECRAYCESPEGFEECLRFAVESGEMTQEEAEQALKMGPAVMEGGPGGCKSKEECEEYCDEESHQEECLKFGLEHGLISKEEMAKMEMMKKADFTGPGGCRGPEECKAFCEDPEHAEECYQFGASRGLVPDEARENFPSNIPPGGFVGPGGCKSEGECKEYCSEPSHQEECLNFRGGPAIDNGASDEIQSYEKQLPPSGPGGCRSEEECKTYCSDPAHIEECAGFGKPPGDASLPNEFIPQNEPAKTGESFSADEFPPSGNSPPPSQFPLPEEFVPQNEFPDSGEFSPPNEPPPSDGYMPPEEFAPPEEYQPPPDYIPSDGNYAPPPDSGNYEPPPDAKEETYSTPQTLIQIFLTTAKTAASLIVTPFALLAQTLFSL